MFVERLSAWKAREQEALAKGKKRKAVAPPPLPFATKNNRSAPVPTKASTIGDAGSGSKRPRIASSRSDGRCVGKENEPSQRATGTSTREAAAPAKMQEKAVLKVVSGGIAEEMEKRLKEKLEWSERQKRREEEVRRRKEAARLDEAVSQRLLARCSSGADHVESIRNKSEKSCRR